MNQAKSKLIHIGSQYWKPALENQQGGDKK